jgi:natural product biosynthesis luciferase-like monooxygenase protein
MKFGIFQLLPGAGRLPSDVYERNLEMARTAEQLGFYSLWVAEHHFSQYGLVNDTLLYLSAVAAQTSRIRLGTGVVVVPLHHPIRLAENVAFVDALSRGRLDLGIGRGYQPHEFIGFDVPQAESQARTDEIIAFAKAAWSQDEVDWDGPFFRANHVRLVPRPVQRPDPPLWTAAVSPGTFERAGQRGERILTSPNFTPIEMIKENFDTYRSALARSGHDPAAFDYPVMQQVYVAQDAARGFEEPREASMEYFSLLGRLLPSSVRSDGSGGADPSYDFYRKVSRNVTDLQYDFLFEHGVSFGDANRVADRIRQLEQEVGMNYFLGWFNFGSLDHELAMRSLRRFADQVMARFDVEEAPVPAAP